MGKLIRFPTERVKKRIETDHRGAVLPSKRAWRWQYDLVKVFEDQVLKTIQKRRFLFISELFRTLGMPNSGKLFTILGNLEKDGKVEQPERGWYRAVPKKDE